MSMRLVFAAGGTGGHLFPALAVAERIRGERPEASIVFIGTHGKMEERIVPQYGFPLRLLWMEGIDRKRPWRSALLPFKVIASIVRMVGIMRTPRASAAVCAGSFVSYPVGVAARILGVPLVLMESNARPGLVIARLSQGAVQVHVAFEASRSLFRRSDNVVVSGNPVREDLALPMPRSQAAAEFHLDAAAPTLLVFGGSLGAKTINNAIGNALHTIVGAGIQVIWQTGANAEPLRQQLPAGVWRGAFIDNMRAAYAASDLAVCRAGGTTIAELTAVGVASVLVPYPHHADQHQVRNAEALQDAGAAVMIDDEAAGGRLVATALALLNDHDRLKAMRAAALEQGRPDATEVIARSIIALAESGRKQTADPHETYPE
jgi:UDP-N-acetylglucosamine--N-acetylmuramyl-(pentapeptide) pyrophosphoryl-undecaprenol N-acetylglucosamine transferase